MFNKRCTLSEDIGGNWQQVCMGDLQVYYDPELFTARICIITDNGEIVSNTIIGVNTVLEVSFDLHDEKLQFKIMTELFLKYI